METVLSLKGSNIFQTETKVLIENILFGYLLVCKKMQYHYVDDSQTYIVPLPGGAGYFYWLVVNFSRPN